jgi:hypothetical protein
MITGFGYCFEDEENVSFSGLYQTPGNGYNVHIPVCFYELYSLKPNLLGLKVNRLSGLHHLDHSSVRPIQEGSTHDAAASEWISRRSTDQPTSYVGTTTYVCR